MIALVWRNQTLSQIRTFIFARLFIGILDHLQFDYLASCKEPVTANSMIWSTGPEMLKWLKDPTSSTLQSTMCPVFGFRKLDPEDKGKLIEPDTYSAIFIEI